MYIMENDFAISRQLGASLFLHLHGFNMLENVRLILIQLVVSNSQYQLN